jgi:hypothetical protein
MLIFGGKFPDRYGEGVCNDWGLHLLFFDWSYQVLLTDVIILRWAIQAPGSL